MNSPIKDFKTTGIATFTYPTELRVAVDRAVRSWKRFYNLPTDIKKSLPYSNNGAGVGYELKDGVGNKADRKENFDVTVEGKQWLKNNIDAIKNPTALEFIEDATALVDVIKPLVLDFARQVEKEYNLQDFTQEVEASTPSFFFRFIHYFGDRNMGEETATAHVDQSGFTLHLFESDPGLQCLTYQKEWKDMPVSEKETVIIPCMQMQLRSHGELKALCHRVIANEKTAVTGRYSAVCFVQLKKTKKYDKDTHGRLQEKEPGFNYEMNIEEFSKLFK